MCRQVLIAGAVMASWNWQQYLEQKTAADWNGCALQGQKQMFLGARLQYKMWYFGHYHDDVKVDDRHQLLYESIIPISV